MYYENSTANYRQIIDVVETIAHEYAHQFFGNLVSPEEWAYLWLNEGFATLFEVLLPSHLYPDQRSMDMFPIGVCQKMFQHDAMDNTRPMTNPVYTPTEISNSFDNIAYGKCKYLLINIFNKD